MIPLHDDNPAKTTPYVTFGLIIAGVSVFLWQLSLGETNRQAIMALGLIPAVLLEYASLPEGLNIIPPWLSVFSSMFMHGGWMHLIGNMLFLWIFGDNVEDAMGRGRFILFYLVCGIAAAAAQVVPDPQSTIPMIGASGAISGVLGAYLMLYPRASVLVVIPLGILMFTQRIAAGWVLVFWFAMQLISSVASNAEQGGVAFGAHIGGFIAGVVLISLFKYKHVQLFAPAR
jgi:membrane associated rhomboid family serine protease